MKEKNTRKQAYPTLIKGKNFNEEEMKLFSIINEYNLPNILDINVGFALLKKPDHSQHQQYTTKFTTLFYEIIREIFGENMRSNTIYAMLKAIPDKYSKILKNPISNYSKEWFPKMVKMETAMQQALIETRTIKSKEKEKLTEEIKEIDKVLKQYEKQKRR